MPNRTALRRLARYVLAVWLFALGSGVVNACLVSGELRHGVPVASLSAGHDMAHHGMSGHDMGSHEPAAHAGGGDQHGHDKPPCERLCDAPAVARVADQELISSLAGLWLASAPLPTLTLRVFPAATHAAHAPEPPWRATVPLSIAFQRLAL